MPQQTFESALLIALLGIVISYHDVRYRRIPNVYVSAGLVGGLLLNTWQGGWHGLRASALGCVLAFCLMFAVRIYSRATGPGDIKLFGAIGSIIGWQAVWPAFLIVLITGAVLAVILTLRAGTFRVTMERVLLILYGFLPGHQIPRFPVPANHKQALPYGVAICLGSLLALVWQLPHFG